MPNQKIGIDELLVDRTTITIDAQETAEDRQARIKREGRQHTFEMVRNYVVLGVTLIVGAACLYEAVFDAAASADTKRWAQTALTALFSGSVSFVLGQISARKK
jgi:hypothetical protein